jgi:two-component system, OmpR family, response regulator
VRLLVVEDDPDLNRQLATALTDAGYVVDRAFDGEEGHFLGETEPYDAVILDIGLPKMDGLSVLEKWRREGRAMPVLILTARDRWSDKVQGFDAGADDYVPKPFHLEEVLARVRALLRRSTRRRRLGRLRVGGLEVDPASRRVWLRGEPIALSKKEYGLLRALAAEPTRVFTREELLRGVWGFRVICPTRTVDSHAHRLRKKLNREGDTFVVNVWGVGYRLIDGSVDG